jgi:hypothetical protein
MVKDASAPSKASSTKGMKLPASGKKCNVGVEKATKHSRQKHEPASTSAAKAEKPRSNSKDFINNLFASVNSSAKKCSDKTTGATRGEDDRAMNLASQGKAAAAKRVCLVKQDAVNICPDI